MYKPLKVGLVWTGGISSRHMTSYLEHPDRVQLTAVCDIVEPLAQEFAKNAGVEAVYTDFDEMLREADIDAVDNCTGHAQHAPQTNAAAEAGKHVLVERQWRPLRRSAWTPSRTTSQQHRYACLCLRRFLRASRLP